MRKAIFICCFILIFTLTACNSNNESQVAETTDNIEHGSYVPQKAVPENLPIYPDATLSSDSAFYGDDSWGNSWQWFYSTNASGNEIVEFFKTEFQNLGFEIDEEQTFANFEEFFVTTTESVIGVYWLSIDEFPTEVDVNPDTPGREYAIVVNLDEWNN